jgi:NAD(P)H-nitrite reductase large subunit
VRTRDGQQIVCNLVAVAIGIKPRIELAQMAGLQVERGVLVNEYMQTSADDVFAAGDIAQVYDPILGRSVLDSLWGPAREQGKTAGLNMAGKHVPYIKPIAFNVTRLANLTTTIIGAIGGGTDDDLTGIARGDSETWRQMPDAIAAQADFDVNRIRVLVGDQNLLGAIVIGDQTLSRALQHMILHQADIRSIRQQLLQPDAPLGDILSNFWIEWKNRNA